MVNFKVDTSVHHASRKFFSFLNPAVLTFRLHTKRNTCTVGYKAVHSCMSSLGEWDLYIQNLQVAYMYSVRLVLMS